MPWAIWISEAYNDYNLISDAIQGKNKESDKKGHFVPAGAGEVDVSVSVPVQGVSQMTVTVTSQVDFNYHVWRAIFVNGTPKRTLITFHCLKCTWIVLAPLTWHRQCIRLAQNNPVFSPIIAEICADLYLCAISNMRIAIAS